MQITGFSLRRLVVPLGRRIGDNNCAYGAFDVAALRLDTDEGLSGWGFGEKAHGGVFLRPVSWKAEMPPLAGLRAAWTEAWPGLAGRDHEELLAIVPPPWVPGLLPDYMRAALRMALWDLLGKAAGQPLFRLLGGHEAPDRAPAYLSLCEFPQPIEWVEETLRRKVGDGFRAVKLKVGHPDREVDLDRLRRVRAAIGPDVALAVDANTAWTASQALRWVERAERAGLQLSYLEDPLPPTDLAGYRCLARECPLPLAGHDYLPDPSTLRPLLDTGALRWVRLRDGLDHARAAATLAAEYGLRLILCNTFAEHALHAGLGRADLARVEFADLGWNALFRQPVRAVGGHLVVPPGPGFGLEPDPARLEEFAQP